MKSTLICTPKNIEEKWMILGGALKYLISKLFVPVASLLNNAPDSEGLPLVTRNLRHFRNFILEAVLGVENPMCFRESISFYYQVMQN
jgi:hypothetical protein